MSENEKNEQLEKKSESAPKAKEKKPGIFARIKKWFKEMKSELKKVQWPSFKSVMKSTLVVIISVIIIGIFIWGFDLLATSVVGALLHLAGKG